MVQIHSSSALFGSAFYLYLLTIKKNKKYYKFVKSAIIAVGYVDHRCANVEYRSLDMTTYNQHAAKHNPIKLLKRTLAFRSDKSKIRQIILELM